METQRMTQNSFALSCDITLFFLEQKCFLFIGIALKLFLKLDSGIRYEPASDTSARMEKKVRSKLTQSAAKYIIKKGTFKWKISLILDIISLLQPSR